MNDKVEELVERVRLTGEEIDGAKADAVAAWLEENKNYTSPRMLSRLINSDELKQLIDKYIAQAQLNKVLNAPGLALIDRERESNMLLHDDSFCACIPCSCIRAKRAGFLPIIPIAEALKEQGG